VFGNDAPLAELAQAQRLKASRGLIDNRSLTARRQDEHAATLVGVARPHARLSDTQLDLHPLYLYPWRDLLHASLGRVGQQGRVGALVPRRIGVGRASQAPHCTARPQLTREAHPRHVELGCDEQCRQKEQRDSYPGRCYGLDVTAALLFETLNDDCDEACCDEDCVLDCVVDEDCCDETCVLDCEDDCVCVAGCVCWTGCDLDTEMACPDWLGWLG
jgi:hypothetical protein